ncbi:MAG: DNA polymerase [Myxococcales bacterium]|nr:DNA polymerase [Myxococcales bacterium]
MTLLEVPTSGVPETLQYNPVRMTERTLIASATNLLVRGFQVVPVDRTSRAGEPVNGLFAVARALHRVIATKRPTRALAVIDPTPKASWPAALTPQLAQLPELCRALGLHVIESADELNLCASYAHAALALGDDVLIAGVDKRYAQLVGERCWWFDANKDVRYTTEIVQKRFAVPPSQVAQWLALVGDEDQVPGIKGIGAKGASEFLAEHGSLEAILPTLDTLEGRVAKALRAAKDELPGALAQARLETSRALPVPLAGLGYVEPNPTVLNTLFERLAFSELLVADAPSSQVEVCENEAQLHARLSGWKTTPVALEALIDEVDARDSLVGIGLSIGDGTGCYVATGGRAWPALLSWLQDSNAPKQGHDLVGLMVALRRTGVTLAGVVGDSACSSHLTQPSNWAPHDLALVAKHVLGRALPDDDEVLGVGKGRKRWSGLSIDRAAQIAGHRADASAAISTKLAPGVEPALLKEYLALEETLVRMELTGLMVDRSELERAEASFATIEVELEKQIAQLAGHTFNINSSKQLGVVLFEELKLPIVSHTRTGWSTANEALERIADAHPIVPLVMRWRGLRRLRDSWLISLRSCIDTDSRVHSRFHLARSFSGHLINTRPDLGRVPGRTPEMSRVRRAFVAPPGKLLMSVDFNQLGLYVLAHLTKDPALVEPLRTRADLHRLTAAAVLEKPTDQLTLEERQVGKVVNFATFAGQGASSLAMQLGISAQEAKAYIARFDQRYAKVRAFQDEQLRLARAQGFIVTISGRRWPIGGLESLDSQLSSYAERLARRATHEGSVSDLSRRALLDVDTALRRDGLRTVPLLQILDEVLFEVPEDELQRAAKVCSQAMRSAFVLEVPLVVGVEAGKTWADLEPVSLDASQ